MKSTHDELGRRFATRPVLLAPMEDVSDPGFRRLCRELGADLCVTGFVRAEMLLSGCRHSRRKATLAPGEQAVVQLYGRDAAQIARAAARVEAQGPLAIDLNCGCSIPRIATHGAGAGWLREPEALVAMVRGVVEAVSLPVTVKTRIGLGPERTMPIVDLARRLEDAGVAALTLHCRTAAMGWRDPADWSWAARVREVVGIPVVVNGDVRSAADARRALEQTGCAGVMVGRRAIEHPWVFREIRAYLDTGVEVAPPTARERLDLVRRTLRDHVAERGEARGVAVTRRHLRGYLQGVPGAEDLWYRLVRTEGLEACLELLEEAGRSIN